MGPRMRQGLDLEKAEAALKRAAEKALRGTREERSGRVISSVIAGINYDPDSRTLYLRFVSGRRYRYSDVPAEVGEALMKAESKGSFFNAEIRDAYESH